MATDQKGPITKQPDNPDKDQAADDSETFETDISETGEDGTEVRQAEVRKDDLSETKPSSDDKGS
ncbi:hypothetical protein B0G57_101113 [Trinickia symbiotica]|uniref:Uncharacterized protein n=1 Tax=Trinickia symbiotica TaxID=863227 RepID=A0A2N7X983_9BURK|nr:hypothetical protein [Trinickia symbiotica]PMS38309.1 hypothetical protein C0Z20_05125 [Trinickia symbiotica]PPK47149.1 hypothetical protein B0G57_101113 [Trinickia symbiotica]